MALKGIFPYDKNNDSKEYNNIIYTQYCIHLALLQYHKKLLEALPMDFNGNKEWLLNRVRNRIKDLQDIDIPHLNAKRLHILEDFKPIGHNTQHTNNYY